MSLQKTPLSYQALASALHQQGTGMTPAEMHGLLSGMVCGGNSDHSWKTLVHELTNEGLAFPQSLAQPLQALHDNISDTLEREIFMFHPLLPDENKSSVFERADALVGWVNHFLLGLGITQPKLDRVTGDTGEAIADLRTIAQLGYDKDDDEEELAQSLEEVVEYVRIAALLCHETFNTPVVSVMTPEPKKPTLH